MGVNRKFLGFVKESKTDNSIYITKYTFCEGADRVSLINNYCEKSGSKLDSLRVNEDGEYSDRGFPIYFIPVQDTHDYLINDYIPQFADVKDAVRNPFAEDETYMFIGYIMNNKTSTRERFGLYSGRNMKSLINDFSNKTGMAVKPISGSSDAGYSGDYDGIIMFGFLNTDMLAPKAVQTPVSNPFIYINNGKYDNPSDRN